MDRSTWTDNAGSVFWAVAAALTGAGAIYVFLKIISWANDLIWAGETEGPPFEGSVRALFVLTIAGLLTGVVHRFVTVKPTSFEVLLATGGIEKGAYGAILVSTIALFAGFSVGPEMPCANLAAVVAVWLSGQLKVSDAHARRNVVTAVVGGFAGMFTAPFAVVLLLLEIIKKVRGFLASVFPQAVLAAVAGFALFFGLSGNRFSGLLRSYDLPVFKMEMVHLAHGVALGLAAALLAVVYHLLQKALTGVFRPLRSRPILRGVIAGFALGLLAWAMPLTLFPGDGALQGILSVSESSGLGLLSLAVLAKLAATAGALSAGIIGGTLLPMLSAGGMAGVALHAAFPALPPALCVAAMMAALPSAIMPGLFMFLSIIAFLVTGISVVDTIPIIIAAATASTLAGFFEHLGTQEEGAQDQAGHF